MELLQWWADRPAWIRYLVALFFLGAGGAIGYWISIRLGIVPMALGLVMLAFAGKDDSEKKGYRF